MEKSWTWSAISQNLKRTALKIWSSETLGWRDLGRKASAHEYHAGEHLLQLSVRSWQLLDSLGSENLPQQRKELETTQGDAGDCSWSGSARSFKVLSHQFCWRLVIGYCSAVSPNCPLSFYTYSLFYTFYTLLFNSSYFSIFFENILRFERKRCALVNSAVGGLSSAWKVCPHSLCIC